MGKFITKGSADDYYGITRSWCVGHMNLGTLLDLPHGEERWGRTYEGETQFQYDLKKDENGEYTNYKTEREHINRYDFEEAIRHSIEKVMTSGSREDIVKEVNKALREDYIIEMTVSTITKAGAYMDRFNTKLVKVGEEQFKEDEITTDLSEITPYVGLNDRNIKVELHQPYISTSQKQYNGNDAVKYLTNKIIKETFTYCTKKGKNIVPDEYLKNGLAGIQAYQADKRSKNKSNSIEKQLVKSMKKEKISTAFETFCEVMRVMLGEAGNTPHDWTEVFLAVDGRWNTGRRMNVVKRYIINMTDDELIKLSDSEIKTRCKNYWKVQLQKAIKNIDEIM